MDQHIYLTGLRGTGKTSVGRVLAETLGLPLVDLDDRIEQAAGKSIREIFADGGETAFRDHESECLEQVAGGPPAIVALGGGAILRSQNRQRLAQTGLCVWLVADAQTLVGRIQSDQLTAERRPALTTLSESEEVKKLVADREPLYRQAADHRVDTAGKSIEQVADEILSWIRRR